MTERTSELQRGGKNSFDPDAVDRFRAAKERRWLREGRETTRAPIEFPLRTQRQVEQDRQTPSGS